MLTLKPGTEPVRSLVQQFLRTWQFDAVDSARGKLLASWVSDLLRGTVTLRDLLDSTELRYLDDLHQPKPPAFLLHIDQGDELYVRAEEGQRRCFSEILAEGLADPRLRALMSLHLAADIARRAAEELSKDAGALPLLSYLLDDMWKSKDRKWDGVLRLPAPAIELGRVLSIGPTHSSRRTPMPMTGCAVSSR